MKNANRLLLIFCWLLLQSTTGVRAQVSAHAGPDQTICPGTSVVLGAAPAATGGLAPYTYSWSPATGLSASNIANPTASPATDMNYTLTVTDDTGAVSTDVVSIINKYLLYVNAGSDTSICEHISATIGSTANVVDPAITYSWSPGATLNDSTLPRPVASPVGTTSYTLTATYTGCTPKTDVVTITVIPTPPINAGTDTTILQGETAILHGSGGYYYAWFPIATLNYYYTANPDAEPNTTTTYYLYGTDPSNTCPAYDTVTVTVIDNDQVVIYNAFSPNGDSNNDTWFIGNILNYPDCVLEVYNRYGKLLYRSTGYQNDWDGKAFGQEIPSGTYFYKLELGQDKDGNDLGKYHGTVTIIR